MGANIFSIDLSLRSTGIVFSNGETLKYDLIKTKADELNGEELFLALLSIIPSLML